MILIRDANIIDGTGRPPFRGDVLLKGDRISAIGQFPKQRAETVIDALGSMLTPGFIDVNTDSDHYLTLFTNPSQHDFLLQGVTTIIGGNCGASLAPLLYGSLESIRKWSDINQINVDWHTVGEFLAILAKQGVGVNFGTLAGHSTIRRALIGEALRDLTTSEHAVLKRIVRDALRDGALGISSGLGYAHSQSVPHHEMKAIAAEVAEFGGVYATHLRDERARLPEAVSETILLAKETGARTLVSHMRPLLGFERAFSRGLALLESASGAADIHFDSYPFDTSLVPLYTLLPQWAQRGSLETMADYLHDRGARERILRELPPIKKNDVIIVFAPGAEFAAGKNIGNFAENRELDLKRGLLELMVETKLRAVVFFKNVNMDLAIQSLQSDSAFVASNNPSFPDDARSVQHERMFGAFTKFLRIVAGTKCMAMEQAIRKITALPAKKFRLRERGEVKEGQYADLVLLKDRAVTHVMVNGEIAVHGGVARKNRAGRILRSG